MKNIVGFYIKTSRPRFWLYLAGTYLLGFSIGARDKILFQSPIFVIYFLYFFFFANLFLYGVNDYFDHETDLINPKKGKKEILLKGDYKHFLKYYLIFYIVIVLLLLFIEKNLLVKIYLIIFNLLSFFYSSPPFRLKGKPFLDFSSNILYALPGFIGFLLAGGDYIPFIVILISFFWTSAMHLFSAIPDISFDKSANITTSAVFLGEKRSLIICILFWTLFAFTLFYSGYFGIFSLIFLVYPVLPIGVSFRLAKIEKLYWYYPWINGILGFTVVLYSLLVGIQI